VPNIDNNASGMATKSGDEDKNKQNSIPLSKVGLAFVIVAILVAAYYLFSHSSPSYNNPVISVLATHKPVSFVSFANTMLNYVNSTKQLNVSYNGTAILSFSSSFTGGITMSIPIEFSYQKYYSISRFSASLSDIPMLGNASFVIITNKSGSYFCTNSSSSYFNTGKSGFTCMKSALSQGSSIFPTNLNNIKNNLEFNVEGYKQASYNGQPCYIMVGKGIANISSSNQSFMMQTPMPQEFAYNITSCISLQYGIPLNFSMSIASTNKTSPGKFVITINERAINTNTNPSIASLPGPIENITQISSGFGIGNSTIGTISTNESITTSGFNTSTITTPTIGTTSLTPPCNSINLSTNLMSQIIIQNCTWNGGGINITIGGGNSGWASVKIIANKGTPMFSNAGTYWCPSDVGYINLPKGNYTVIFRTGNGGGSCGNAILQIQ
jgi:hypothetical protein